MYEFDKRKLYPFNSHDIIPETYLASIGEKNYDELENVFFKRKENKEEKEHWISKD